MSTVAHPKTLDSLVRRIESIRPESIRKWGTMTPGQMLCHLADATDSVLGRRASRGAADGSTGDSAAGSRFMKWLALRAPLAWPKGRIQTTSEADPTKRGTRPGDFEADRRRALEGLKSVAAADPGSLLPTHQMFGPMKHADWLRWAYRHTDHHLRQFGV